MKRAYFTIPSPVCLDLARAASRFAERPEMVHRKVRILRNASRNFESRQTRLGWLLNVNHPTQWHLSLM